MKTNDILHETYSSLSANKARSGLTMLGIIIGIASVIAMTAIGKERKIPYRQAFNQSEQI